MAKIAIVLVVVTVTGGWVVGKSAAAMFEHAMVKVVNN